MVILHTKWPYTNISAGKCSFQYWRKSTSTGTFLLFRERWQWFFLFPLHPCFSNPPHTQFWRVIQSKNVFWNMENHMVKIKWSKFSALTLDQWSNSCDSILCSSGSALFIVGLTLYQNALRRDANIGWEKSRNCLDSSKLKSIIVLI